MLAKIDLKLEGKEGKVPLVMEFPMSMELDPILISGVNQPCLWLDNHKGKVRAGLRNQGPYELDVLDAITARSIQDEWGNIQDFGEQGFLNCFDHLRSYEIEDIEVLVNSSETLDLVKGVLKDVKVYTVADWVPPKCAVFLPVVRADFGVISQVGKLHLYVVHNPGRSIAAAR